MPVPVPVPVTPASRILGETQSISPPNRRVPDCQYQCVLLLSSTTTSSSNPGPGPKLVSIESASIFTQPELSFNLKFMLRVIRVGPTSTLEYIAVIALVLVQVPMIRVGPSWCRTHWQYCRRSTTRSYQCQESEIHWQLSYPPATQQPSRGRAARGRCRPPVGRWWRRHHRGRRQTRPQTRPQLESRHWQHKAVSEEAGGPRKMPALHAPSRAAETGHRSHPPGRCDTTQRQG